MIDPHAASFERVALDYERGRPGWPPEALELAELPRSATVLDLGAGTGKLTAALLERFSRVIAVEPLDGMRALIPTGAEAIAGTAEQIPLAAAAVDGIFVGEAFHWFDWPRALEETARVLRPGGALVLLWNRPRDGVPPPWPAKVSEALERARPHRAARSYRAMAWRKAFRGGLFGELRFTVVPHEERVARDLLLARISSWSNVAAMPETGRRELLTEVAACLTEPSYLVLLDTHVYTTRRAGRA